MSFFKKIGVDIGDFDEKDPVFQKIIDLIKDKDERITSLNKQLRRAKSRYTYSEENIKTLLNDHVKLFCVEEEKEKTLPYEIMGLGEFNFKKGKLCFIRDRRYGSDNDKVFINGEDVGSRNSKTTNLSIQDVIEVKVEGAIPATLRFELQNLFVVDIDPDDLPEIGIEDEDYEKPQVKGFSLDDD